MQCVVVQCIECRKFAIGNSTEKGKKNEQENLTDSYSNQIDLQLTPTRIGIALVGSVGIRLVLTRLVQYTILHSGWYFATKNSQIFFFHQFQRNPREIQRSRFHCKWSAHIDTNFRRDLFIERSKAMDEGTMFRALSSAKRKSLSNFMERFQYVFWSNQFDADTKTNEKCDCDTCLEWPEPVNMEPNWN